MDSNRWKGTSIVSSYYIALYRKHMAPGVTAGTLDRDCTSISEYLATVPRGKQWVDALLSSTKYLVLDLCLYVQDTCGVSIEKTYVYVEEGKGLLVDIQSHPKIEVRLLHPQWGQPSFCALCVRIPGLVETNMSSYRLAEALASLGTTIQRVLGMAHCSTCTLSNDNNSYCGVGAQMYTGNCMQREARHTAPYTDIGGTTS